MFYVITKEGIVKMPLEHIAKDSIIIAYVTIDELNHYEKQLGIAKEVVHSCMHGQSRFSIGLEIFEDFSFGMLTIIDIQNVKKGRDKIAFFMRKDAFIFVEIEDRDHYLRETFQKSMHLLSQNITLEKVIFTIFEHFIADGNIVLDKTEQNIMALERDIVQGKIDRILNKKLFEIKRQLTIQKNYYDQLVSVVDGMRENENHLFNQDHFKFFKIFTKKAERLSSNSKLLCEDLVHVREALDAALDYSLNSIMKVFTVVTTIFMPLTLIVGWYGMNFANMPELTWRYGYGAVVLLSLLVVAGCFWFFKKKKLI